MLKWGFTTFLLLAMLGIVITQYDGPRRLISGVLRSDSISLALSRVQQFLIPENDAGCLDELAKLDAEYKLQSNFTENKRCIVEHAVRLTHTNGMSLSNSPIMTCRMAVELTKFTANSLQPTAIQKFGSAVATMSNIGTYNCRSMRQYSAIVSQHGFANAIDVTGFTLADGTNINVANDWNSGSAKAEFLKEIAYDACEAFRVSVSPDGDANHWNHLHWDMGPYWSCR
jgi:hypothetical protein